MKCIFVAAAALVISAGPIIAQPKIEKAPIKPTSAARPSEMFKQYCAPCHGIAGTGNGPAASSLTKPPADLTKIAARNGGKFPDVKVRRYIEGADEIPAHGTRDMPMWGDLFRSLNRDTAEVRVAGLTNYIKTMQR